MARFGQGLIQALTNPAYADQLSTVGMMAGSLKGRRDAEEEEKAKLAQQRAAQSSIYAMMNQGNPNDPNVANSVLEVANSQGLDLEDTQKALVQAQKTAMERERLEMSKVDAKYRAADQAWQEEQRRIQEERTKVTSFIEGAIANNANLDRALDQIPLEHKAFAREQIKALEEFNQGKQERAEKAALRVPLTEEQLSEYESVVGKEAVNAYRRGVAGDIPVKARMTLENLYNDVTKAELTARNSDKVEKMLAPSEAGIERARAAIDRAFVGTGMRGFLGFGTPSPLTDEEKEMFAVTVASQVKTDPKWQPTEDNLLKLWEEVKAKNGMDVPKVDGKTSTGVTWTIKGQSNG